MPLMRLGAIYGKEEDGNQKAWEGMWGQVLKYKIYGYRLKEIADYLAIHYTTVSKALKNVEEY